MDWNSYKGPCEKNCPDRAMGCQSRCEKYKAYRAKLDAEREACYRDLENQREILRYYRQRKTAYLHGESRKSK